MVKIYPINKVITYLQIPYLVLGQFCNSVADDNNLFE